MTKSKENSRKSSRFFDCQPVFYILHDHSAGFHDIFEIDLAAVFVIDAIVDAL